MTGAPSTDRIAVYWMPGCSNCLRLKEYVSKQGFDFVAVNLQEDPAAVADLEARGIKGVPVITRGDRYAFGVDLAAIDEILGIGGATHAALPASDLVDRSVRFAATAVRLARQLPTERYWDDIPGRERSYLVLANHVIGHLNRFVTHAEDPERHWDLLSHAAAGWQVPRDGDDPERFSGARTKDYIEDVLTVDVITEKAVALTGRLRRWLASEPDLEQRVRQHNGEHTVFELLRSCTYSMAQHTRQLQAVVTYLGYAPDGPLSPADLEGLELPEGLWDEL